MLSGPPTFFLRPLSTAVNEDVDAVGRELDRSVYPARVNVLDVVLVTLVGVAFVYGLMRGFVRIAVGLAGVTLSLAFAFRLADRGPGWFADVFADPSHARLAAFVAVLVGGLLATALVAKVAAKLVQAAEVGWLDRLLGAGIAGVGACFVSCALLVGMTAFLPPGSDVLRTSRVVPAVLVVVDAAASILPPDMARQYHERREALAPSDPSPLA